MTKNCTILSSFKSSSFFCSLQYSIDLKSRLWTNELLACTFEYTLLEDEVLVIVWWGGRSARCWVYPIAIVARRGLGWIGGLFLLFTWKRMIIRIIRGSPGCCRCVDLPLICLMCFFSRCCRGIGRFSCYGTNVRNPTSISWGLWSAPLRRFCWPTATQVSHLQANPPKPWWFGCRSNRYTWRWYRLGFSLRLLSKSKLWWPWIWERSRDPW